MRPVSDALDAEAVRGAARRFAADLSDEIGAALVGVYLYGSLVKGDYRPEDSDHNVAVVLGDDQTRTLRGVTRAMERARPSDRTALLLVTREELDRARDVFPLELRDLARHHERLAGEDRLSGLEFDRGDLARVCERQLRNLTIRLRRLRRRRRRLRGRRRR